MKDYSAWASIVQHGKGAALLADAGSQFQAPVVSQPCVMDPVGSLQEAICLAVLCMLALGIMVWLLAGSPEASAASLPLAAGANAGTPLLQRRATRLDALDGLRTVLVMYIVIYHVRWALPPYLAPWFQTGHWAVQFFFVLSGFVAASGQEASGNLHIGIDKARTMAIKRMVRLCPPYFIALLGVAGVVALRGGGQPYLAWPIQALLLQSLLPVKVCGPIDVGHWSQNFLPFSANGEGWFVSAILICGLCFPLVHNARPRGGLHYTLLALLVCAIARSIPTFLLMSGRLATDMYTFAPVRILEFACGALSAQLFREMKDKLSDFEGWDAVFDCSLFAAAIPVWFLGAWHAWAACEASHGDYFLTIIFCVTCIAARGMAELTADGKKERTPLARFLTSTTLVAAAMYSYQAYVYQEVFIAVLALSPQQYIMHYWWLPVVLTWAAGIVSVHSFEEPLNRAIQARLAAANSAAARK